jgi:copper oxidase (laccase) domain-containing protein
MAFVLKNSGFAVFHSIKQDGNMGYDFGSVEDVNKNRVKFFNKNNINGKIHEIQNCHSQNIALIKENDDIIQFKTHPQFDNKNEKLVNGIDGLFSFDDISICGITGDCIPLTIWEPESHLHGMIHIGLMGSLNDILNSFVQLISKYNINIQSTHAYLGPAITVKNYNISKSGVWKNVGNEAKEKINNIDHYIESRENQLYFNTKKMVIDRLISIGLPVQNILNFDYCTAESDSLFFSHFYSINNNLPNARFLTVIR